MAMAILRDRGSLLRDHGVPTGECDAVSNELKLLVLLVGANAAPIIGYDIFKQRFAWPVDFGLKFLDGHALLGPSKTWRGIVLALGTAAVLAPLLGIPARSALLVAALTLAGDILSSFIKRRLGKRAGSDVILLDQVPESLFPLLAVRANFGLTAENILFIILAFIAVDYVASRFLFKLHLRKHPY